MNIILLGPPGSCKGTQGELLSQRGGVIRISTGDLLRDAVRKGTSLGRKARSYMDQGLLVPDEVIIGLLREVLGSPPAARGGIMDGFPRTVAQAEAVDTLLRERGGKVDYVLLFEAPEYELKKRILGRASQAGRADDNLEALHQRLQVYRAQTQPLVDFYRKRGNLIQIDAVGSIPEVAARIQAGVGI
jgi:adenylate kinase